ncbi:hypothetical protein MBLNU230_g7249t1 [Neophaeotheca triangularis]
MPASSTPIPVPVPNAVRSRSLSTEEARMRDYLSVLQRHPVTGVPVSTAIDESTGASVPGLVESAISSTMRGSDNPDAVLSARMVAHEGEPGEEVFGPENDVGREQVGPTTQSAARHGVSRFYHAPAIFGTGSSAQNFQPLSRAVSRVSVDAKLLGYTEDDTDEDGEVLDYHDSEDSEDDMSSETSFYCEGERGPRTWGWGLGLEGLEEEGEDEEDEEDLDGEEEAAVYEQATRASIERAVLGSFRRQPRRDLSPSVGVVEVAPEVIEEEARRMNGDEVEFDRRSTIGVIDMVREQLAEDDELRGHCDLGPEEALSAPRNGSRRLSAHSSELSYDEALRFVIMDGLAPLHRAPRDHIPQLAEDTRGAPGIFDRLSNLAGPRRKSSAPKQRKESIEHRQSISIATRRFSRRLSSTVDSVAAAAVAAKKHAAAWIRKDSGYESAEQLDSEEDGPFFSLRGATEGSQELEDLQQRGYVGPPLSESWLETRARIIAREGWDPWPLRTEEEKERLAELRATTGRAGRSEGDTQRLVESHAAAGLPRRSEGDTRRLVDIRAAAGLADVEEGMVERAERTEQRALTGESVADETPIPVRKSVQVTAGAEDEGPLAPRQSFHRETRADDGEDGRSSFATATSRMDRPGTARSRASTHGSWRSQRPQRDNQPLILEDALNTAAARGRFWPARLDKEFSKAFNNRIGTDSTNEQTQKQGHWASLLQFAKDRNKGPKKNTEMGTLPDPSEAGIDDHSAEMLTIRAGRAAQEARLSCSERRTRRRDWIATADVIGVAMSGGGPM